MSTIIYQYKNLLGGRHKTKWEGERNMLEKDQHKDKEDGNNSRGLEQDEGKERKEGRKEERKKESQLQQGI